MNDTPERPDPIALEQMQLDTKLLEALLCPISHGPLQYDRSAQELISRKANLAFPIRNGVPIMLESEARALED